MSKAKLEKIVCAIYLFKAQVLIRRMEKGVCTLCSLGSFAHHRHFTSDILNKAMFR